ncbi:MAG: MBL fold metallo-hydrolase [Gammaproteobacteria bacterium]|nr:MBL fold metallo-hydrolase [Gammaproteobacteria bacterium]
MPDQLTITVLVDNKPGEGLTAEHGLSLWVEFQGTRILFDTGQGPALEDNAHKLGINLHGADALILSHGHYDHTGGIAHVLRCNDKIDVYCHPGILKQRYSLHDGVPKPIQMPDESLAMINTHAEDIFHWVTGKTMLNSRIGITGPIPRETSFEDTGGAFYLDKEIQHKDLIEDELALWIDSNEGLVVFTGCGHAGIINTLNYICRLTGRTDIYAVIGGFHLIKASEQRLEKTISAFESFSIKNIIPCHCTGEHATNLLTKHLGQDVLQCQSGHVYRF